MKFNQYLVDATKKGLPSKIPLIDLPAGTVLFRAGQLHDYKTLYSDFLGRPTKDGFCLSPQQNTFTFPFPFVGFGLYDWITNKAAWNKYNYFQVYVLLENTPIVNIIKPAKEVRGSIKGFTGPNDDFRRCHLFDVPCATTPEEEAKSKESLSYDNCINRDFTRRTGVLGSISIAEKDSLDDREKTPKTTPLGEYIRLFYEDNPEEASKILLQLYVDAKNFRGIPEVCLYTNKHLEEGQAIRRDTKSLEDCAKYFMEDLRADNYSIAPVALITAAGVANLFDTGSINNLKISKDLDVNERRQLIEQNLRDFMNKARVEGLEDLGRMKFDCRTGFFVFEGLAPNELQYKKKLLLDITTDVDQRIAEIYSAALKKPVDKTTMFKGIKINGVNIPKCFIFERPASLGALFKDLELKPPSAYFENLIKIDRGKSPAAIGGGGGTRRVRNKFNQTKKLKKSINIHGKISSNSLEMPVMKYVMPHAPTPISKSNLADIKSFYHDVGSSIKSAIKSKTTRG